MTSQYLRKIRENSGLLIICILLIAVKLASVAAYGQTYGMVTYAVSHYIRNETASEVLSLRQDELGRPFQYLFLRFDSSYYLEMAKYGYSNEQVFAFAPGYPLLARMVSWLGVPPAVSLVLVSNILGFLSVVLLYHVARLYLSHTESLLAAALFAFYPYNIISWTIAYSDSAFAVFSLLSWLMFERKRYGWCGAATLVASLVRFQGMLLYAIYSLIILSRWRKGQTIDTARSLAVVNITLLLPVYWLFVQIPSFTGISYTMVQAKYWNGVFSYPLSCLLILAGHVISAINLPFIAFICAFGLLAYRIRPEFALYTLVFSAFYLSLSGTSARYFGTVWPAFIYAGQTLSGASSRIPVHYITIILFAALGVFLLVLQMNSLFIC
ncbi:MAG: mannosyltransferase family protein [Candidatus Altiarchaeota archaeon]|nr:mannosyltransferase family protein [Candidatus Altiarchaeota archaeon]